MKVWTVSMYDPFEPADIVLVFANRDTAYGFASVEAEQRECELEYEDDEDASWYRDCSPDFVLMASHMLIEEGQEV